MVRDMISDTEKPDVKVDMNSDTMGVWTRAILSRTEIYEYKTGYKL